MFARHEPEVLVVGAGPVGLTSALALARHSVDVEIIDEEIRTAAHSYALALHPGTLALLHELGVSPEGLDRSLRVDTVALYDGLERKAELRLADLDCEFPYLLVVRQSELEDVLERALKNEKVKVRWHHRLGGLRVEGDRLAADVDTLDRVSSGYAIAGTEAVVAKTHRLEPRFLIGADGHRSTVRQALGLGFDEVAAPELFAVFELECEPPLETHEVCVVLDGRTTNVLWPLPDGRCRWSFQVWDEPGAPYDLRNKSRLAVQVGPDFFPHVTPELLSQLIDQRAPWFGSWPGEIYWSVLARFERRLASAAGTGRAWLAGDAIHLTGPVGIQSMNVGMREGADLADRVAQALGGGSVAGLLEGYGVARIAEWRRLLGLDGLLVGREGPDAWPAKHRAQLLSCLPASGSELEQLAGQLGLRFEEGAAVGGG
jgi:2-polyprenyl-6-methoxyphenol hydroxylase-like FAD-dependent oxidoreductase